MAELNKTQLASENQSSFPTNNLRQITAAILRDFNQDMIDSLVDEIGYNIDSASLSSSLSSVTNEVGELSSSLQTISSSLDTIQSLTGSYATTASNDFKGSQTITGSAYGNIVRLVEVSNSQSIDLREGNFFSGSVFTNTHFNITNPKIGQTAILKITTIGAATASFSPNVFQPSGSEYIPTPGPNNTDILTIAAFDNDNVYIVSSNKFI